MSAKETIMDAALRLLEEEGPDGLTTRAVCLAAGVTAPTIYHHFGDKTGLLHAVVSKGVADFMVMKRALRVSADPLADLRRGWDGWIDFGLQRPTLFRLMIEAARSDPTLARGAYDHMQDTVIRLEAVYGLRVDLRTAIHSVWAASSGLQALFLQGAKAVDIKASSRFVFEAITGSLIASPDGAPG